MLGSGPVQLLGRWAEVLTELGERLVDLDDGAHLCRGSSQFDETVRPEQSVASVKGFGEPIPLIRVGLGKVLGRPLLFAGDKPRAQATGQQCREDPGWVAPDQHHTGDINTTPATLVQTLTG